jgi:undecaprenyl-diphosphatase
MNKCILFIFCFLGLNGVAQPREVKLLQCIHTNRDQSLDGTMLFLSKSNQYTHIGMPIIGMGIGYLRKDSQLKKYSFDYLIGAGLNGAFTLGIKYAMKRPRPGAAYPQYFLPLEPYYERSFPSGHTSSAFCTATQISLYARKWYYVIPAYCYAGGVAYSRMHIGVHYPSDVAAGIGLGITSAWVSHHITQWMRQHKKINTLYQKKILR